MDERRLRAVLAALLRESGRVGPGPESSRIGACEPSVELARQWLAGRPTLAAGAGSADAVADEITSGAPEAYARLGFEFDPRAADHSSAGEPAARAMADELERIPDGPPECVVAALMQVLDVQLGGQPGEGSRPRVLTGWHDLARQNAALADLLVRTGAGRPNDRPLLFVRGELVGLDQQIFGTSEQRFVPADKPALIGRAYRTGALGGAVLRRLLAACDSPELAQLTLGHGRFLLLVPNLPEVLQRLNEARDRIEEDLLRLYQGELCPCVSWTDGALSELKDAAQLRQRLDAGHRRRGGTPFLGALASKGPEEPTEPFGPYGTDMQDDQDLRAHDEAHRKLGTLLKTARFGIELESWPVHSEPLSDEAALTAALAGRPDGPVRVEWPGTRDGLRSALQVSAGNGGRILLAPSSSLPVQCEIDPRRPVAAAHVRIRLLPADEPAFERAARGLSNWLHRARLVTELTRSGAAGLAQGRSITIISGSGSRVVAVGPMKAMLSFIGRLQSRLDQLLGAGQAALDAGFAVRSGQTRRAGRAGEPAIDFALLVRQARDILTEQGAARQGPGLCWLFGAEIETTELYRLQQLGDGLARLTAREPSRMRAVLEAAVRIGRGGDLIPLSEMARLRAKIHQLAARLGVNARTIERYESKDAKDEGDSEHSGDSGDSGDTGETRALKELILNFDRMFDSGAARVPLAYAVALSETHATELSS